MTIKKEKKKDEKSLKKLIYLSLIFSVSIILLVIITLGWFVNTKQNNVDAINLAQRINMVNFFFSEDDVKYDPEPNSFTFQYLYPGKPLYFKVEATPSQSGYKITGKFLDISLTTTNAGGAVDPGIDLMDVLRIKYVPPGGSEVNDTFANLASGARNITLFQDYVFSYAGGAPQKLIFNFIVYMEDGRVGDIESAGNEYQDLKISIGEVLFTITEV